MKEISSYNMVMRPLQQQAAQGPSRRRNSGDLPAPAPVFDSMLDKDSVQRTVPQSSRIGTAAPSGILLALSGNRVAPSFETNVEGAGRKPASPPRNPASGSGEPPPAPGASPEPPAPRQWSAMQQNWLDANTGRYSELMRHNLSREAPFEIGGVDILWANGSTGKPEFSQRAIGNVSAEDGQALASLMGGTLVQSPFGTFGNSQRDQYIRMPNGQMIEASVLAHQLNAARNAQDPFSATQNVLEIYRLEAEKFDLAASTNAVDLVSKGSLIPGWPAGTSQAS